MRLFKLFLGFIFLLLSCFVLYVLYSTGLFRSVKNLNVDKVYKKISVPGAEDIAISYSDNFAIVSSTKRGVYPPTTNENGNLFFIDLNSTNFEPELLKINKKLQFAPHGIDIFKIDSTYLIMAINHTVEEHTIEVFSLENKSLKHLKTIRDKSLVSPNDIVILNSNEFYFTNDHGYTKGFGKFLEEYVGLAASNVIHFNGSKFSEVANKIAYANGINFDKKRELMYIASPRNFLIKVYKRLSDGQLEFIEDIDCKTGVDNIFIDNEGLVWTGAHPNLLKFSSYAKGKSKITPSEILSIKYTSKNDYTINPIYREDGSIMSGSSAAAKFNNFVLLGNVADSKFIILDLEK